MDFIDQILNIAEGNNLTNKDKLSIHYNEYAVIFWFDLYGQISCVDFCMYNTTKNDAIDVYINGGLLQSFSITDFDKNIKITNRYIKKICIFCEFDFIKPVHFINCVYPINVYSNLQYGTQVSEIRLIDGVVESQNGFY